MLGYMTKAAALQAGFTHHGAYYGIPLWLAPYSQDFPVATKWAPMEWVMSAFVVIEQTISSIVFPNDEPAFQFSIGEPIEP
jgi:hypothetical protein